MHYFFNIILILSSFSYSFETRTIGGSILPDSDKTKPWVLAVGSSCTASLISDRFALTAFHCIVFESYDSVKEKTLLVHKESNTKSKIKNIYLPFKDQKRAERSDIVIIELETPITSSSYVKIPSVSFINKYYGKQDASLLVGYGYNDTKAVPFSDATELTLSIMDRVSCDNILTKEGFYPEDMLCTDARADSKRRGKDIGMCAGDSGGPLVIKENNDFYQIGVVSGYAQDSGINRCGKNTGLYVNVSSFASWIKTVLNKEAEIGTYEVSKYDALGSMLSNLEVGAWKLVGVGAKRVVEKEFMPSKFNIFLYRKSKFIELNENSLKESLDLNYSEGFWFQLKEKKND